MYQCCTFNLLEICSSLYFSFIIKYHNINYIGGPRVWEQCFLPRVKTVGMICGCVHVHPPMLRMSVSRCWWHIPEVCEFSGGCVVACDSLRQRCERGNFCSHFAEGEILKLLKQKHLRKYFERVCLMYSIVILTNMRIVFGAVNITARSSAMRVKGKFLKGKSLLQLPFSLSVVCNLLVKSLQRKGTIVYERELSLEDATCVLAVILFSAFI